MMHNTTRNLAIDWIKGWMILWVVLHHTWNISGFRGYLAVDVFFFISGFFLMRSYISKPTNTISYTWKRIKGIATPFFISLFVGCCFRFAREPFLCDNDTFVANSAKLVYSFAFAESFGVDITTDQLFLGSWFISVLIISSFFLYGMLEHNYHLSTRVLFPIITLLGFNALITCSDTFSSWSRIATLGIPLLRGITEMAAGALIASAYSEHKSAFEKQSTLINIMGIVSFGLFSLLMFTKACFDKYLVITVPWILLSLVIDGSWLSKGLQKIHGDIFSWIGKYTLYILCAHGPAIIVVNYVEETYLGYVLRGFTRIGVILSASALATILLYQASKKIQSSIRDKCKTA